MKSHGDNNAIQRTETSRGFTLLEVLVAVTIFATALAALLSMVGAGISQVSVSKNKLTANYLAQEGIELVRYQRDYAVQNNPTSGWATFMSTIATNACNISSAPTARCGISELSPLGQALLACQQGTTQCQLFQNTNGAYDFQANMHGTLNWQPTVFTRYVYFENPTNNAGNAIIVHSVVTWQQGEGSFTTDMSETLYNWY